MSFSRNVKKELSVQLSKGRHCLLAELATIISYSGRIIRDNQKFYLVFQTENIDIARKYFTLIKKTFNINLDISVKGSANTKKVRTYTLMIKDTDSVMMVLKGTKLFEHELSSGQIPMPGQMIVQNNCCKRAFIRGAFLSSGSISNPKKTYHFEIVLSNYEKAVQLQDVINGFSMDAKIIKRKKYFVVYIKEGAQIVEVLNVMEAHVALMDLENVRILKEMRNSINRQVNCEAANIGKTVIAASKYIEDIKYIKDTIGFSDLPKGLEEIAILRTQHPEAALKELGEMLIPPLGKSGVNHRLRKLSVIADQLRESKEE